MARPFSVRRGWDACAGALVLAVMTFGAAAPASAAAWFVSTFPNGNDANPCNAPNAPCRTIAATIAKALPGDVILATFGIFTGSGPTEVVHIGKDLNIDGGWDAAFATRAGYTIVSGEQQRRGVFIAAGVRVQMNNVAIVHGHAPVGGGIYVEGQLTGFRMLVALNRALRGGGIFFNGYLGTSMALIDSAVVANEFFDQGGGLFVDGSHKIDLNVVSAASFINTTISNNVSIASQDEEHGPSLPSTGAGVFVNDGYFVSTHSTFAENTIFDGRIFTQNGAGIAVSGLHGPALAQLANTLVADGCLAPPALIQSDGFNVERLNTCDLNVPQDRKNVNPLIFPATLNPGPHPTVTHAIAPASPAIDWANPQWCTLTGDQRGVSRPQGASCDVGAFERTATDRAMGFMSHPGRGWDNPDRCQALSWTANGKPRHNQCRVDVATAIEAILGVGPTTR